jgi:hypothetical protein
LLLENVTLSLSKGDIPPAQAWQSTILGWIYLFFSVTRKEPKESFPPGVRLDAGHVRSRKTSNSFRRAAQHTMFSITAAE